MTTSHTPPSLRPWPRLLRHCAWILLLIAGPFASLVRAQDPVPLEVAAFFPESESDSWLFVASETEETTLTLHATEQATGSRLRFDRSDGSIRVEGADDRSGWTLSEEAALGGRRLVFEEPLTLLPARTETGAAHEAEGRYRLVENEEPVESGTVRAVVAVGALTTLEVPAGTFEDCLVVELTLEFSKDDEPDSVVTAQRRIWRARGVGTVQEVRHRSALAALAGSGEEEGAETAWRLAEASVGGTLVTTAEDTRPSIDLGTFNPPPR